MHVREHLLVNEHVCGHHGACNDSTSADNKGSAIASKDLAEKICELLAEHINNIFYLYSYPCHS
jgi:hypothetical protein